MSERGEQRGNAVMLVVVGYGASASLFHLQAPRGAVRRLDLTFLIGPEHDGEVGIDVQPEGIPERIELLDLVHWFVQRQ
jgi:NAD(P)H-dependent FMN reductase